MTAMNTTIDYDLMLLYRQNRSLHQPWFSIFVVIYIILILVSFFGNLLILLAVFRRREMHLKPRNQLIALLAASDLLLSVTMPLTAVDGLTKFWPFGQATPNLCRMVKSSSAVAVYMSSMIIMAIATDRFRCIVHSTRTQLSVTHVKVLAPTISIAAVAMALPLAIHSRLHTLDLETTNLTAGEEIADEEDWSHLVFCIEDWRFGPDSETQDPTRRLYYSIFSASVQYLLPFLFISVTYGMIYFYLRRYRLVRNGNNSDLEKIRRTNVMLSSISVVYCISWFPLNLFSLLADAGFSVFGTNQTSVTSGFIICHLFGMSSACTNPIFYGYWNESFRNEFSDIRSVVEKTLFFENIRSLSRNLCGYFAKNWNVFATRRNLNLNNGQQPFILRGTITYHQRHLMTTGEETGVPVGIELNVIVPTEECEETSSGLGYSAPKNLLSPSSGTIQYSSKLALSPCSSPEDDEITKESQISVNGPILEQFTKKRGFSSVFVKSNSDAKINFV